MRSATVSEASVVISPCFLSSSTLAVHLAARTHTDTHTLGSRPLACWIWVTWLPSPLPNPLKWELWTAKELPDTHTCTVKHKIVAWFPSGPLRYSFQALVSHRGPSIHTNGHAHRHTITQLHIHTKGRPHTYAHTDVHAHTQKLSHRGGNSEALFATSWESRHQDHRSSVSLSLKPRHLIEYGQPWETTCLLAKHG